MIIIKGELDMITLINRLKKELIEKSRGKQLVSDEVVKASQELDIHIVDFMERQIEMKKAN